uniref:Claudin 8.3 n=1 Tax=Poecilia latipinna TaxID=48699 RepID=A0A3B3VI62_9TELE
MAHQSSVRSSHHPGSIYTPGNSSYVTQTPTLYTTYTGNTPSSFQSSFHPVPQTPVFIAYKESMVHPESRLSEIAAICTGLIGLIGASATTGLPMWKVTITRGENKTEMARRWEGLWMNCYNQANIRMQCKVYYSLLHLSPDLQAGRGLMCSSVTLSGLGLLFALAGMKCIPWFQDIKWVKTMILMVAGGIQFMACICIFIPVSWTGQVILRDLYDPPLTDTQKREMGGALYIGWVAGTFLFASALLFTCRCFPTDNKPTMTSYHPVSTLNNCIYDLIALQNYSVVYLPFLNLYETLLYRFQFPS